MCVRAFIYTSKEHKNKIQRGKVIIMKTTKEHYGEDETCIEMIKPLKQC